MPALDMNLILHDIDQIRLKASRHLGKCLNDQLDPSRSNMDYAVGLLNSMRNDVRHMLLLMSRDDSSVPDRVEVIGNFNDVVRRNYNEVMKDILSSCEGYVKTVSDLETNLAGNDRVFRELSRDADDLASLLDRLEGALYSGMSVEEQEEPPEVDDFSVDDISIGDVYLVLDRASDSVSIGICRSIIQTSAGKTVSSNDDGTGSVRSDAAVFFDPFDYVEGNEDLTGKLLSVIEELIELEREYPGIEVSKVREAEEAILFVIMSLVDKSEVIRSARLKR